MTLSEISRQAAKEAVRTWKQPEDYKGGMLNDHIADAVALVVLRAIESDVEDFYVEAMTEDNEFARERESSYANILEVIRGHLAEFSSSLVVSEPQKERMFEQGNEQTNDDQSRLAPASAPRHESAPRADQPASSWVVTTCPACPWSGFPDEVLDHIREQHTALAAPPVSALEPHEKKNDEMPFTRPDQSGIATADPRDHQPGDSWQELDELLVSENGDVPKDVLVYGESIGAHRGRVIRYDSGYVFAGVSHINGNLAEDGTITHWMPLPSPPQVEP